MITSHANGVRIAFGESFGDGPIFYRTAVLMSAGDIAELFVVLSGIIRPPAALEQVPALQAPAEA